MITWIWVQWAFLVCALPLMLALLKNRRHSRVHSAYCLILFLGYLWAFGQHMQDTLRLYFPVEWIGRVFLYMCYAGLCGLGPASVYLAWCYAGKHALYRDKRWVGMLIGVGAFFFVVVVTNDFHHLYYVFFSLREHRYNVLFYIFTAFSYMCIFYAYVTIQRTRWDAEAQSSRLFLLCFLPPMLGNTINMFLHDPFFCVIPAAYCVMLLGIHLIIWYHRPVIVEPMAARQIINDLTCPVLICDDQGMITYRNRAGARLPSPFRPGNTLLDGIVYTATEIPLDGKRRLVLLTDITQYDQMQTELTLQKDTMENLQRVLSAQAGRLVRQGETAVQLAAHRRRIQIMSALDAQVRGKLETLRRNTRHAMEAPTPHDIQLGKRLAADTLETVRSIVRNTKGELDERSGI